MVKLLTNVIFLIAFVLISSSRLKLRIDQCPLGKPEFKLADLNNSYTNCLEMHFDKGGFGRIKFRAQGNNIYLKLANSPDLKIAQEFLVIMNSFPDDRPGYLWTKVLQNTGSQINDKNNDCNGAYQNWNGIHDFDINYNINKGTILIFRDGEFLLNCNVPSFNPVADDYKYYGFLGSKNDNDIIYDLQQSNVPRTWPEEPATPTNPAAPPAPTNPAAPPAPTNPTAPPALSNPTAPPTPIEPTPPAPTNPTAPPVLSNPKAPPTPIEPTPPAPTNPTAPPAPTNPTAPPALTNSTSPPTPIQPTPPTPIEPTPPTPIEPTPPTPLEPTPQPKNPATPGRPKRKCHKRK